MVDGLGNKQSVKGISVMHFQVADLNGVGKGNSHDMYSWKSSRGSSKSSGSGKTKVPSKMPDRRLTVSGCEGLPETPLV
jgi:hypothetical protein